MPGKQTEYDDYSDIMLPESMESVHLRCAISCRNNWMILNSDYVVTYISHSYGSAARYASRAQQQGKVVTNLASL